MLLLPGTLLTRLHGHTQDVSDIFASTSERSLYFASSSSVEGENSLRVWNLNDNTCVGVYKMHVEVSKVIPFEDLNPLDSQETER